MYLIVGLGNPGDRYAANRHNIGFMALDLLVDRHNGAAGPRDGFGPWRSRFKARVAEGRFGADRLLALKPSVFMNLSGQPVAEAARFFSLPPSRIIVIHDDLDLPAGALRVKQGGGAGGHNGLRSLDAHLGPAYWRLRLGIGHPGHRDRVNAHVLGNFSAADYDRIAPALDAAADCFPVWLRDGPAAFTNAAALRLNPPRNRPAGDALPAPGHANKD